MPEAVVVAKRLKAYRKARSKTQFEMASEMGISVEQVSLIERERAKDLKLSTLQKISAHMGITVSELLAIEDREAGQKNGG